MASIEVDVEYTEDEMWEDYLAFVESEDGLPVSREKFVADLGNGCILRVGADGTRYWTMPRAVAAEAFCDLQEAGTPRRVLWRLH